MPCLSALSEETPMPRIQYFENDTDSDTFDWNRFAASIDSDSDPRESKRPVQDDEWCDEDDYDAND